MSGIAVPTTLSSICVISVPMTSARTVGPRRYFLFINQPIVSAKQTEVLDPRTEGTVAEEQRDHGGLDTSHLVLQLRTDSERRLVVDAGCEFSANAVARVDRERVV